MASPTQRRPSTRRGSISACDPYGTHLHLNENPNRSSWSTLTIVRATSPPEPLPTTFLHEPPSRRNHSRHGSDPSAGSGSPQMNRQDAPSSRLSFASSSFAGNTNPEPVSNNNLSRPSSSWPSSPNQHLRAHSHSLTQPRLSSDQVLALARQPTCAQHDSPSKNLSPYSPGASSPGSLYGQTVSTSFTPLAADVFLPFIDRPAEVSALISGPPSAKLFSLLAQTFPKCEDQSSPSITAVTFPTPKTVEISDFPEDPTKWTFRQLFIWLTVVPRTVVPDALWVRHVRSCIHERSELIWERVKGALGVPPELDMDDDADVGQNSAASSDMTIVGLGGEGPTPQSLPDREDHQAFVSSPIDANYDSDLDPLPLSIENIMATSTPPSMMPSGSYSSNPPPLSLPSSLAAPSLLSQSLSHLPLNSEAGLQNISEDQEETEDDPNAAENRGSEKSTTVIERDYTTAISPEPQGAIQGLKISTSSLQHSPIPSPTIHRRSITSSPSQQSALLPLDSPGRSFSVLSAPPHSRPKSLRSSSFGSLQSSTGVPYDPVGDRVPGNPLFPSNFARLVVGPTLKANNPSLRSPPHPPAPAYPFMRGAGTGRSPSRAEGWDSVKQEHAVTAGSGSSVVGE